MTIETQINNSRGEFADNMLIESGNFVVGCNYWASHAGMLMWRDWQPEVIAEDLKQLSGEGVQVMRVFPLWPDFQPLTRTLGGSGNTLDLRFGEKPLPDTPAGKAGVEQTMVERFRYLADCAHKNGISLIVGIITGWMSGRLFAPPAFVKSNLLTDPEVIRWQVLFVRYLVQSLRGHPAICAWDLGNECNSMESVNREQAWCWTHAIASAIRLEDNTLPVVSGMHSLGTGSWYESWRIQDQGDLTDLLTTHPYPLFTPHCNKEPLNRIRNCLHATAESRWYADISGKPCIAEEVGNLGPNICSDKLAGEYVRTALFSLWANDCHGMLWWCSYDQDKLENSPYDQNSIERELGLNTSERKPKDTMKQIGAFAAMLKTLPFERLPLRKASAVCLLTRGQDCWGAAFGAFILAKQAGFDLEFRYVGQPLPDAKLYLVPSVYGMEHSSKSLWRELQQRAEEGATVYVSTNDGIFSPFKDFFGAEVISREIQEAPSEYTFSDFSMSGHPQYRLNLDAGDCDILSTDDSGGPAFICNNYGKGKIYFLSFPLEKHLIDRKNSFAENAAPAWKVYGQIASDILDKRVVKMNDPFLGTTEHVFSDSQMLCVVINYSDAARKIDFSLAEGWLVDSVLYGEEGMQSNAVAANDALLIMLKR